MAALFFGGGNINEKIKPLSKGIRSLSFPTTKLSVNRLPAIVQKHV